MFISEYMVIYVAMYMYSGLCVMLGSGAVPRPHQLRPLYLLKLPMRSTHPTSLSHHLTLSPSPFLPSFLSPFLPPSLPPSLRPSLPLHQPGFDVNATSMNGRNALHYAADYGQVEVVQLLLEKKANIDVSNIQSTCTYMYSHVYYTCVCTCTKCCTSKC